LIQCPRCKALDVYEERHVLLDPQAWQRRTGLAMKLILGGLVLGALLMLGASVASTVLGPLLALVLARQGPGASVLLTALSCLIPSCVAIAIVLALVGLSRGLIRHLDLAALFPLGRPAHSWPRIYKRTCQACGHRWSWKPGQPQAGRAEEPGAGKGVDKSRRSAMQRAQMRAYQPYLDELVSLWDSSYVPGRDLRLETAEQAIALYEDYQRALGAPSSSSPVVYVTGYFRNYDPRRDEILSLMGAYVLLRRGRRGEASRYLQKLVSDSPTFADGWLWLSATLDDPAKRLECLEKATHHEPAHPLAADALAIAQGALALPDRGTESAPLRNGAEVTISLVRCPQCGGSLHYEPGAAGVTCSHCGHTLPLQQTDLIDGQAPLVSTLRLRRVHQGHTWAEVERVLHCRACGAVLAMTDRLAQTCAYCGSPNVLVEDKQHLLEQPDGFVPFKIDRQQAIDAVKKTGPGKQGYSARAVGIYVPAWIFDGVVQAIWKWVYQDGKLSNLPRPGRTLAYNKLVFAAVRTPPPSFLDQVLSLELGAVVPYEPRLLADWPAQVYTEDVEATAEDAHDAMLALAQRDAGPPLLTNVHPPPGARALRILQLSSVSYQLLLLPVWMVSIESEGESHSALVNGQTGQVAAGLVRPG
jgi:hypothetical protein